MKAYSMGVIVSVILFSASLQAWAQAPSIHWSTFDKQASECACRLFAKGAFAKEGLKLMEDAGPVLLAGNHEAVVEVVCRPGGRQITVSAFSSDSVIAERARNNVRAHIVRAVLMDTCP
jgi:hypothetical protein